MPFKGYTQFEHNNYTIMIPDGYRDKPTAMEKQRTGQLVNGQGHEICLNVHEKILLSEMSQDLQILAIEYKRQLTRTMNAGEFYMVINSQRTKKMNLSDDIAAWSSWEMLIHA